MFRTLKNYIFWKYERGSLHYDVMVTLILAFIFITPHLWDFGDRPNPHMVSQVLVDSTGEDSFVYQIRASDVAKLTKDGRTDDAIREVLQRVAGNIDVDHWQPVPGPDKTIVAYKVWAHR